MTTFEEGATGRVGYYRRPEPEFAGDVPHEPCGEPLHDHGWLDVPPDGVTLCPGGDWSVGDLMQFRGGAWRRLEQPAPVDPPAEMPPIMRWFDASHLTNPRLQAVVAEFAQLAQYVVDYLPRSAEQSVALRKLLEAKDAAVRAALEAMPDRGLQKPAADAVRQVLGVREIRVGEVCCGGSPMPEAGEPTFQEGSGGACCRDESKEGPNHG